MTLESIQEDILIALKNKNPSVKAESVAFLARCFTKCTPTILNKKMLKIFTTVLIKTLNESGNFLFKQYNLFISFLNLSLKLN